MREDDSCRSVTLIRSHVSYSNTFRLLWILFLWKLPCLLPHGKSLERTVWQPFGVSGCWLLCRYYLVDGLLMIGFENWKLFSWEKTIFGEGGNLGGWYGDCAWRLSLLAWWEWLVWGRHWELKRRVGFRITLRLWGLKIKYPGDLVPMSL